jgi:hypothetical protein
MGSIATPWCVGGDHLLLNQHVLYMDGTALLYHQILRCCHLPRCLLLYLPLCQLLQFKNHRLRRAGCSQKQTWGRHLACGQPINDWGTRGTTPIIQKSHFEFKYKEGMSKKPCKRLAAETHVGRTLRGGPKWAFLHKGSVPSGNDEHGLAVVATKPDRTYKTLDR